MDVVADNMPFGREAMKQFSIEWGFNETTSSPHYHRFNSMAERYVQTVKQFLKKAADTRSLLAYCQTPVAGLPYSPSEMLFSRRIRGPLPCTEEMLKPQIPDALELLQQRQNKQKEESGVVQWLRLVIKRCRSNSLCRQSFLIWLWRAIHPSQVLAERD